MQTNFSSHYYKIIKKANYQYLGEQLLSVTVQKMSKKRTNLTPYKFILVFPTSQEISQVKGEIIKVNVNDFDQLSENIYIANHRFTGFNTYSINLVKVAQKKHALVVEKEDTFKSHDYLN